MMLVGFYLPVRLESGSFIISHKIISVDVISTTNGRYTIMQSISEDDILSYIAKFPNDIDPTLKFVNKKR